MARSAVCSDVLARSARHDMPLARSALTLRALTAQPLTSAVRPRRKPHRVLVMPCDHQPTWLDHSASTINVVEKFHGFCFPFRLTPACRFRALVQKAAASGCHGWGALQAMTASSPSPASSEGVERREPPHPTCCPSPQRRPHCASLWRNARKGRGKPRTALYTFRSEAQNRVVHTEPTPRSCEPSRAAVSCTRSNPLPYRYFELA